MRSMTGYGRAEFPLPDHTGVIELSSVNKKGFELLLHGPKEWQFFEKKAQEIICSKIERGRIRISILVHSKGVLPEESPDDQIEKISVHLATLKKLCDLNLISYTPSTDLVQRILSSNPRDVLLPTLPNIEDDLIKATMHALNEMISMREEEGSSLAIDLNTRSNQLRTLIDKIKLDTKDQASAWRDRLLQRLSESGLEIDSDNEAVRREFAIYAEKSDISEETTRILSHLVQFEKGLKKQAPIGRRLEFIVQELGREFNTLGSKSTQAKVANLVIDAKVEIEKIREQVMNIE